MIDTFYLGYRIELVDNRNLAIYDPSGRRICGPARMELSGARRFIRSYRKA